MERSTEFFAGTSEFTINWFEDYLKRIEEEE